MTKAELLYEDWQKRKISDFKLISELVLLYNEAEKKQIEYQKIAQKTKEYLEFVISGRQNLTGANSGGFLYFQSTLVSGQRYASCTLFANFSVGNRSN